jgi:FkbM family methyltransferase
MKYNLDKRKIFIDCGSFDGCSIRKFKHLVDTKNEFEYFAFEPNPHLKKYHPQPDTTFFDTFVSDSDLSTTFYVCGTSGGSSEIKQKSKLYVQKTKERFGQVEEINLSPIRLSQFISQNFTSEDFIVLKLDIEGSEYKVIQDCIDTGTILYVNQILIEWHLGQRTDWHDPEGFIRSFTDFCNNNNIYYDYTWDAMHSPYLLEKNCSESGK